jgi:hypothetical protein
MVAVSEGPYRLVLRAPTQAQGQQEPQEQRGELYDRASDPREQHELGEREPEVRARLLGLIGDYLERPPATWQTAPDVELGEAELEQLRALGYSVQ